MTEKEPAYDVQSRQACFVRCCLKGKGGAAMQQEWHPLPMTDMEKLLFQRAKEVRCHAYAPYSGFWVGAALLAASGAVYLGVNMENASYPVGICAERAAFSAAITAGERDFTAIAISGGMGDKDGAPCAPCGMCRQTMAELCKPDFHVILENGVYPLRILLPFAFSGAYL